MADLPPAVADDTASNENGPQPPSKRSRLNKESSTPTLSDKIKNEKKWATKNFAFGKHAHVFVLLTLEYHGTSYGGWQRQGPNNKIKYPSVQGTVEEAATKVCSEYASGCSIDLIPTTENRELNAVVALASGRTDRAVHALDHKCLLRLPFAKEDTSKLTQFLVGEAGLKTGVTAIASPFLDQLNHSLPCDVNILNGRIVNQEERRKLRFGRKQYTYLIQQAPSELNRPWPAWNDYTYFVKAKLDVPKMQKALDQMQGTHDFLPLSCEKGKVNTVRTLYKGTITVVNYPFDTTDKIRWFQKASCSNKETTTRQPSSIFSAPDYGSCREPIKNSRTNPQLKQDPKNYQILQIDLEGSGFLRHQVRRMVSVLIKVGESVWEPEVVHRILNEEQGFVKGTALAPGRALWKTKVYIEEEEANGNGTHCENASDNEDE